MAATDEALLESWSSTTTDLKGLTGEELMDAWDELTDARDDIVEELQTRGLYPTTAIERWEAETGAYPSMDDPRFLQKLLAKREFAESLQTDWKPKYDACGEVEQFEATPVQRFVANFLNPRSPYQSALLYHGVGVGKTCSAIQIAEAWLEAYPRQQVIIITPPTIRGGFLRTIFDSDKARLHIGEGDGIPNTHVGCTGSRYLELTGTTFERDRGRIERRVQRAINRRYTIMGYMAFANYIRDKLAEIEKLADKPEKYERAKAKIMRREFSGKLLIIDEAHNLRDTPDEVEDTDNPEEIADAAAGKALTPYLLDLLNYSEGLKLALMTATPMYDNYREIVFLLNLMLINDKKARLTESKIFDAAGAFKAGGEELLAAAAKRYVSFMRGENPASFPIRLKPLEVDTLSIDTYPVLNPRSVEVPDGEKIFVGHLPIVPIPLKGDVLDASIALMDELPEGGTGLSSIMLEKIVQAGNFIVPAVEEDAGSNADAFRDRMGDGALETVFTKEKAGTEVRYRAEEGGAKWLGIDQLGTYSPKFEFLIQRLANAEGVAFVYSRFVQAGALPLALALEANGYTPVGRRTGLLANGIQTPGGRQCALCPKREKEHDAEERAHFAPAYYGMLTGDKSLTPNNEAVIRAERDMANVDGRKMKVIIGSQIASEGVDLRFVREIHVLDSWFHLSKMEQIIGRGIRFCSHSALPEQKRNATIYMYAGVLPDDDGRESADLYSYRVAFRKAKLVGRVTRLLKQYALDCNLNHDAIIIQGQAKVSQIDSQGTLRKRVNINDMPFTAVCDWLDSCDYVCQPKIEVKATDDTTYDEYSARWLLARLREELRQRFAEQAAYSQEEISEMIEAPSVVRNALLLSVVNNKAFQVVHGDKKGYIRYCNGYYVFQPNVFVDLAIPLALRVSDFPVRRDAFTPKGVEVEEVAVETETGVRIEDDAGELWAAVQEWIGDMARGPASVDIPLEMLTRIAILAGADRENENKLTQTLAMVRRFQLAYHMTTKPAGGAGSSARPSEEAFKRALENYFWDNWMTVDEQIGLKSNIEKPLMFAGKTIERYLNPADGSIIFMCGDAPCSRAIIDALKKEDPMERIAVTEETTAATVTRKKPGTEEVEKEKLIYGFSVPKNGRIVFKTNVTPDPGKKLGRGGECGIVSNMSEHKKRLEALGDYMIAAGLGNMLLKKDDLREDITYASRKAGVTDEAFKSTKVENPIRICTLTELVLRYMDANRVGGRRWFYRPVAAAYAGHKGLYRK